MTTKKITFGCPILDRIFGGGIPIGNITEVVGESGSGKTQMMLQLALNTQLKEPLGGQSANCLYLNTELSCPIRRLHEIASNNPFLEDYPLDKVFVHSITCLDEFLSILARLDSYLCRSNVKLIVVDSITTLFRTEFTNSGLDMSRRQQMFFKIAGILKQYAHKYDLAVVVTNQVVDFIASSSNVRIGNDVNMVSSERVVNPALGLSWANCVNTRLMILMSTNADMVERTSGETSRSCSSSMVRRLVVVFAPHLGKAQCNIEINRDGVFGMT